MTLLQEDRAVKKCYAVRLFFVQHPRAYSSLSLRYHSLTLLLVFPGLILINHSPGIPPVLGCLLSAKISAIYGPLSIARMPHPESEEKRIVLRRVRLTQSRLALGGVKLIRRGVHSRVCCAFLPFARWPAQSLEYSILRLTYGLLRQRIGSKLRMTRVQVVSRIHQPYRDHLFLLLSKVGRFNAYFSATAEVISSLQEIPSRSRAARADSTERCRLRWMMCRRSYS